MDYRYSNHVPGVQTSASIRGESCQAELCHVSCVNLLQHNEKTAVALHLIQFHPLSLPPSVSPSVVVLLIHILTIYVGCNFIFLSRKDGVTGSYLAQSFIWRCHTYFPSLKKTTTQTNNQSLLFFQVGCFLSGMAAVNDVYIQS